MMRSLMMNISDDEGPNERSLNDEASSKISPAQNSFQTNLEIPKLCFNLFDSGWLDSDSSFLDQKSPMLEKVSNNSTNLLKETCERSARKLPSTDMTKEPKIYSNSSSSSSLLAVEELENPKILSELSKVTELNREICFV